MNFFSTVTSTFFDPAFYRAKADERRGAFSYYFKLALLLSVVLTAIFCLFAGPRINDVLGKLPDAIVAYYPDDLEVTLNEGSISINQPQPYALPLPDVFRSEDSEKEPLNLVVFNTDAPFSVDAFKDYNTVALITRDAVVMKENSGVRVVPLSDFKCEDDKPCSYTLTNDKLAGYMQHVTPLTVYVLPMLAVGLLLVLIIIYTFGLLALIATAAIAYLVLRLPSLPRLRFGQIYRLCLYAVTPALLITTAVSALNTISGVHIAYLGGFWFELVATIVVLVLNLRAAYPTTSTDHAAPNA